MSLVTKLGLDQQEGGYVKGQKSTTDEKGNRVFIVYTHTGDQKHPLYKDNDEDLRELKIFKGRTPQTVAKKVVTEICQMIKKTDPAGYKKFCRSVTVNDLKKRSKELLALKGEVNIDKKIDWSKYPGFRFELQDTMNSTADGNPRSYLYYGERLKLDQPKKYNGNRFGFEPQVIPIRGTFSLGQALLDHHIKSENAAKREKKNQNFSKHRAKRKSRSGSRKKKASNQSGGNSVFKQRFLAMTPIQISRRCGKGRLGWKVSEMNQVLNYLGLPKNGNKQEKGERIMSYYKQNC